MGEAALYEAIRKGAPLVEITVRFVEGIDCAAATDQLNAIADDFHLTPRPWYDDPQLRVGSATKEALERLFGWRLKRVPLVGQPDLFCWGEVSAVQRHPIDGVIQGIAMEQPGADDDGQWYE
jgi:hypothetical protein